MIIYVKATRHMYKLIMTICVYCVNWEEIREVISRVMQIV